MRRCVRGTRRGCGIPGLRGKVTVLRCLSLCSLKEALRTVGSRLSVSRAATCHVLGALIQLKCLVCGRSAGRCGLSHGLLSLKFGSLGRRGLLRMILPRLHGLQSLMGRATYFKILKSRGNVFVRRTRKRRAFHFILSPNGPFRLRYSTPKGTVVTCLPYGIHSCCLSRVRFAHCGTHAVAAPRTCVSRLRGIQGLNCTVSGRRRLDKMLYVNTPVFGCADCPYKTV